MTTDGHDNTPWHAGERRLQATVGAAQRLDDIGRRVIRNHMPDQHRALFAQLPFIVLGTVDGAGRPWATLLAGRPGFVRSPDPQTLDISHPRDPQDPAWEGLHEGAAAGLLGIELPTRRRNRMNGTVQGLWEPPGGDPVGGSIAARRPLPQGRAGRGHAGFTIAVEHSFGNCPRYIHPRRPEFVAQPAGVCQGAVESRDVLDADARSRIRRADTFFVASYADDAGAPPHRQVDVSHRGGPAGFVRVADDGTLTIPDYAGNHFFNTLGNILANPRAGLAFVDFETGDLLQLSGDAHLLPGGADLAAFDGAERLWTLRPTRVVRRRGALPLRAGPPG